MPVTFHIPGALRQFAGGRSAVDFDSSPATVADALAALWTVFPGLRDRILTEEGLVREHINIFVGEENIRYTGGLTTPLRSNSEITIVPAISGGGGLIGIAPADSRVLPTGAKSFLIFDFDS